MLCEETLRVGEDELHARVMPRLIGRVFHVTTRHAYRSILRNGTIKSNADAKLPFRHSQSAVSYFRLAGCVSVFDLRTATPDQVDDALRKLYFIDPFSGRNPVFLILSDKCVQQLIPWSVAISEQGFRAMVMPFVEAGYPNEVPLALVDSALVVEVNRKKGVARAKRAPDSGGGMPVDIFDLLLKEKLTKAERRRLKKWGPEVDKLLEEELESKK